MRGGRAIFEVRRRTCHTPMVRRGWACPPRSWPRRPSFFLAVQCPPRVGRALPLRCLMIASIISPGGTASPAPTLPDGKPRLKPGDSHLVTLLFARAASVTAARARSSTFGAGGPRRLLPDVLLAAVLGGAPSFVPSERRTDRTREDARSDCSARPLRSRPAPNIPLLRSHRWCSRFIAVLSPIGAHKDPAADYGLRTMARSTHPSFQRAGRFGFGQ